ncbi:MAG: hypothetical protein COA79_26455 [Planctomycetota bacterium]|nr:MAG: hypothetical protein COA79_26455 [Planctomycetota bacterium]
MNDKKLLISLGVGLLVSLLFGIIHSNNFANGIFYLLVPAVFMVPLVLVVFLINKFTKFVFIAFFILIFGLISVGGYGVYLLVYGELFAPLLGYALLPCVISIAISVPLLIKKNLCIEQKLKQLMGQKYKI